MSAAQKRAILPGNQRTIYQCANWKQRSPRGISYDNWWMDKSERIGHLESMWCSEWTQRQWMSLLIVMDNRYGYRSIFGTLPMEKAKETWLAVVNMWSSMRGCMQCSCYCIYAGFGVSCAALNFLVCVCRVDKNPGSDHGWLGSRNCPPQTVEPWE